MKFNVIQDSFSGGEISPRAQGRVSSELYKSCVSEMSNALPTEQGTFQTRAGLGRVNAAPGWERAVKLIPIQDTPLGDIILEIAGGTLRMLDKRGQVLPWNGLLWDFEAPAGQDLLGPSPSTPGASGWYFNDSTGFPSSYVDPVDNKVCLRNTAASGSVTAIAGGAAGILTFPGYPAGTDEGFLFKFSFSGDPITVSLQYTGGAVFFSNRYTVPGDYSIQFTPSGTTHEFLILAASDAGTVSASNVWGFYLTKDGMQTSGGYTAPSTDPVSWLNQVRGDSFWAETSTEDQRVFISPENPSITLATGVSPVLYFSATGGSGTGYVWSLVGGTTGNTINSSTGELTIGSTSAFHQLVQVEDSLGNIAQVDVNLRAPIINPGGDLVINPVDASTSPGSSVQMLASGGTLTGYSFSIVSNMTGGSIDAKSGLYTAGQLPGIDIIQVQDDKSGTPDYSTTTMSVIVPTKIDYFYIILALGGLAVPMQLRYRTPQQGDNPLIPQWTIGALQVRQNAYPTYPLPPLNKVVAVTYDASRLMLGFDNSFGNIAGSQVGPNVNSEDGLFNFQSSNPALATDAINLKLNSPKGTIVWMNVLRGLVLGTTRNEKIFLTGLTIDPTSGQIITIEDESSIGSDPLLPAVDVGDKIAFFTHGRRSMRLAGIGIQSNGGLVAEDPGFLGEHLLYRRVRSFCSLKTPVQRLVFAFDDGTMAIATLSGSSQGNASPWSQPFAWSEMELPLAYRAFCVAALDSAEGSALWVGTESGQSLMVTNLDSRHSPKYRTLAVPLGRSPQRQEFDAEQMPPIMDGWTRRPVTAAGIIPGLAPELIGLTCSVVITGIYVGDFYVNDDGAGFGLIQLLDIPGVTWAGGAKQPDLTPTEAFVGLPYSKHQVTMLPLEGGNPMGTAQGLMSRRVQCYLRLVDSYLPLVGGERAAERQPRDPTDLQASRVTGDVRVTQMGFQRNEQLVISMDKPLRMEVSAVYGGAQVNNI